MKILVISGILPIPKVIKDNDFVFQTYNYYSSLYKKDTVVIIKPVKYELNIFKILNGTSALFQLKNNYSRNIDNFQVEIFPFISSWSFRNIHSLVTRSIYYFNKRRIKSLFDAHHFDLIHAQYIFPDGMLAYLLHKKYKIPYFITTHNERFYFEHFLSRSIALKILSNANRVLPINYTNYLYFKSLRVKNLEMLPLGFNKSFLREQKKLNNNSVSIFTVSGLIKLKNIDKVLRAIKTLVPSYNLTYTIIGKGPEMESLMNLANELGISDYVTFIDHIPHEKVADEMYKHDIFIMTSFFETFGRVYFEVMAMGIPIICSKNSGIYGLFKEFEEGISVNHEDIDEIAEALKFLITDTKERLRIGRNGQSLVQNYTWEYIAKKLHRHYSLFDLPED
jgi:glycosyltransferase involved in cell wall biosynthesis